MLKSRAGQWVVTGIVLGVVLSLAVIGIALRGRLAVATGLDRTLGAPTIPPSVFAEASEEPTPDAAGNLQPAATAPTPGPAPSGPTLTKRLAALDTSKLTDTAGKPAVVAWEILDASTGEVISARNATSMLIPASNTKTLTCTAVFNAFDDQERFVTKVTQPAPGSIVLVGGGDPLLTSEPATTGTYPQPPSLRSLAIQTAKALKSAGTTNVTLGYDTSWFEGPGWASTWPEGYRNQVTPITALWADEGKVGGVRQPDPAAAAATIFAKQLGEQGVTVTGPPSSASGNGTQIAAVESLPVHVLAEQAMQRSNNSFTEVLGFQLAKKTGHPTTFAGSVAAVQEQLTKLGLWEQGAHLDDASGLSRSNKFSPHMLASANRHLITDARLTGILEGLPVAGVTGTLRKRFTDDISRPARGIARAKTGTLSFVSTLGGNTTTADGSLVVYAVMLNGQVDGWAAKVLEDQIVGVITGCGC